MIRFVIYLFVQLRTEKINQFVNEDRLNFLFGRIFIQIL